MKAVLIVGLPGSGKTYLAEHKYVPMGYVLIDDPSNNGEMFLKMVHHIKGPKSDLVITDPHLCGEKSRQKAVEMLETAGYIVKCVFFENNEDKCRRLIELRNDGRNIKTFRSFNYKIPPNIIPLPIYEPCTH